MGEHTKGPWLCAAKPSQLGWPVVAPHDGGRLVCSLNYASQFAEFGAQPGDREFNAESAANGRLIASAPDLLAALLQIDGEAPAKEVPDHPTVGFPPSSDPEVDDGNEVVREAFDEGVCRGLALAAAIARAAIAKARDAG